MLMNEPLYGAAKRAPSNAIPERAASSLASSLMNWQRRIGQWLTRSRQRRFLATLDDRLLRDIGISHAEARREIAKPFWR